MEKESYDNPMARHQADLERLSLPGWSFFSLLDDAIQHAVTVVPADAPARPWVPLGPRNVGGRIRALAQDPRNPNTIYAGSAFGGVWKTDNAGDTWTPLDNFHQAAPALAVRQALPIGAIGLAPSNPQVLYVGTGEPARFTTSDTDHYPGTGLYRSTNGGASFEQIDHVQTGTIRANRYERIVVDPWNQERCWLAASTGLWRREGGPPASFTQDVIDAPAAGAAATQLATDVIIVTGDPLAAAPPATFTVYAALYGVGIFRATFDRVSASYVGTPAWTFLNHGISEPSLARARIALCRSKPEIVYAVFSRPDHSITNVFRSANRGDRWERTADRPEDSGDQGFWYLTLEVHAEKSEIVFFGSMDVFRTMNAGDTWEKVLDWRRYDQGDRAQHADQHAMLFDGLDSRKIWVANDGGISMSRNLGRNWRKRSHGILCAQFTDIAVHPVFPSITGGGMQDNGTWVGYGGPTWLRLFGADGGAMAFDPTSSQRYFITWQGAAGSLVGLVEINVFTSQLPLGDPTSPENMNPLPDLPPLLPAVAPNTPHRVMEPRPTDLTAGFAAGHGPTFVGVVEHHPAITNHLLVGRKQAGYLGTLSGGSLTFSQITTPALTGTSPEVTTVAYAPADANNRWWVGTNQGQIFFTINAGGLWTPVVLPGIGTLSITDIAVHPATSAIVAISVGGTPGRVYLSGDEGTTWIEVSGRSIPAGVPPGPTSPAGDQLSPSPITCIAWDPQTPAGVANLQTLYAGTLAGVYVARNLSAPTVWPPPPPPPPPPPNPQWRTFNNNLPLVLVEDLKPYVVRDAANNIVRTGLRCATHGRGLYEADLAARPEVRLLIRDTVVDDGFRYEGTALLANDPRLNPSNPFTNDQAFDIRIDAPPFSFFEETLDGVEFDEEMRNDLPVAGERNVVYVQIHTTGWRAPVEGVEVHLYFADVTGMATPPLQADFWTAFPADPPAGAWQRAAPPHRTVRIPGPAQPMVVRFEWTPPLTTAASPRMALLAVCTHADDDLKAAAPRLDPAVLIAGERRVAMRLTDVSTQAPDVFVRDGIDDAGSAGAVAWGGRSADIIVQPAVVGDPDTTFADLADVRRADAVVANTTNFIYVRVHNPRHTVVLTADVEVFLVPQSTPHQPNTWTKIGNTVQATDIPARGWKFAAAVTWENPPDPLPAGTDPTQSRYVVLAAIITLAGDTPTNQNTITDLDTFWRFWLRENNAALRGLPYRT